MSLRKHCVRRCGPPGITALLILGALLIPSAALAGPSDPLEPFNRAMYAFNDVVDRALIKPLAIGYRHIIPNPVRRSVGNFFSNLRAPTIFVNDLLQGKPERARQTFGRFLLNSTVGIFGLIDVATPLGLPYHTEDYGQTLAVWGVPSGPYLVLPLLGPSTVRGIIGKVPEFYIDDPLWNPDDTGVTLARFGLRLVDMRSRLLDLDRIVQMQVDPYLFMRETYLQNRQAQIFDGATPPAKQPKELELELLGD